MQKENNEAGYTANTTRGQLGKGLNDRFHNSIIQDRMTNRWIDGLTQPLIDSRIRD